MSATRRVVKGEGGYRLVFRAGLVWLVRRDGSVVHVSRWRPCCPTHVSMAAQKLAAISAADWLSGSEAEGNQ